MLPTTSELTAIKSALLASKAALQEALEVASRTNCASLHGVIDWTVASLANQVDYVNNEISKQRYPILRLNYCSPVQYPLSVQLQSAR